MQENPDYKELAEKIRKIDMNIHTLEELRVRIGEIIDQYL
jgi:citrate lyase alpha subunit